MTSRRVVLKPIAMTVWIDPPRSIFNRAPPTILASVTVDDLCVYAKIWFRVYEAKSSTVLLVRGRDHYFVRGKTYVGVGPRWRPTRVAALRALEVLAHGFHQHEARGAVCHQGLFVAPTKHGRQLRGNRSTAKPGVRRPTSFRSGYRINAKGIERASKLDEDGCPRVSDGIGS